MTDKEKIREEVEKLKSNLIYGACSSQIAMETRCKEEAYNEVLAILDTIQKEPVSEELEEVFDDYTRKVLERTNCLIGNQSVGEEISKAVKFGAELQKEQMMTKAVDAVVSQVPCSNEIILRNPSSVHWSYLPYEMNKLGLNKGDKVKVIVIKED